MELDGNHPSDAKETDESSANPSPVSSSAAKGHASLLRQAVNNRTDDPRLNRPSATLKSSQSVNPSGDKTPPVSRSLSTSAAVDGSAHRTSSPGPKGRAGQLRSVLHPPSGRSQRENSPAPNLADLEFPPPPPPLEDDEVDVDMPPSGDARDGSSVASSCSSGSPRRQGQRNRHPRSPKDATTTGRGLASRMEPLNSQMRANSADRVTMRQYGRSPEGEEEDHFVLGQEMSVEENSLMRNIQPTESESNSRQQPSPNTTIESANSVDCLATSKSADSLASSSVDLPLASEDNGPTDAAPHTVDATSGGIMSQSIIGILRSPSVDGDETDLGPPPSEPAPSPRLAFKTQRAGLRHVEMQLVAELKEKTNDRQLNRPTSQLSPGSSSENLAPPGNPPSVQSVSELFDNLRLKAGKKPVPPVAGSSDTPPAPASPAPAKPAQPGALKPTGKKADLMSESMHESSNILNLTSSEDGGPKFDFKSRLRKVVTAPPGSPASQPPPVPSDEATEATDSSPHKSPDSCEEHDDAKRKSSGSINSLKRLWEKEQQQQQQQPPLQPPPQPLQPPPPSGVKEQNRLSLKAGSDKAAGARCEPEKPAVPAKPSLSQKPPPLKNSAIYATPTSSVINAATKPPVANRLTGALYAKSNALPTQPPPSVPSSQPPAQSSVAQSSGPPAPPSSSSLSTITVTGTDTKNDDRQKIMSLCSEVEQVLSLSAPSTPAHQTQWTQWTHMLQDLHLLCSTYADCIAPHGRFHFRQLIAKLESQAKEVKQQQSAAISASLNRNSAQTLVESIRLASEVRNTVRDVANALQR